MIVTKDDLFEMTLDELNERKNLVFDRILNGAGNRISSNLMFDLLAAVGYKEKHLQDSLNIATL